MITHKTGSGRQCRRPTDILRVMVEGEHLTFAQIAARIGVTAESTARRRVRRLQAARQPLTWDALKCTRSAS